MVASSQFYTEASRQFMEALLSLVPGTQNGGIFANKAGYHNTRKNLVANTAWANDYSQRATVDKQGPSDKAAGYDWTFPEAQGGDYKRISLYMGRVKRAFDAKDPRLKGWREVLGQEDPDLNAEGFDFDTWTTRTPDSSHLWHIHFSEHRAFVESWANKQVMLDILKGVPLVAAPTRPIVSMLPDQDLRDAQIHNTERYLQALFAMRNAEDVSGMTPGTRYHVENDLAEILTGINAKLDKIIAKLEGTNG